MLGKIKYSYIPQTKSTDAILSSLAYAIKATGAIDYMIIDNKATGRRLYPNSVSDYVMYCDKKDLPKQIESLYENDIEIVLVNGFDISLDEVRKEYCDLVKDKELLLCINNILDLEDSDSNISIFIEPDINDLDDEEWVDVKEEILQSLEEAQKESAQKIKKTKNNDSSISSLLSLFGLDKLNNKKDDEKDATDRKLLPLNNLIDENYLEDVFDLEVIEQYSYMVNDSELVVSLTADNEFLINNGEDFITVPDTQIKFLIESLTKLIDR